MASQSTPTPTEAGRSSLFWGHEPECAAVPEAFCLVLAFFGPCSGASAVHFVPFVDDFIIQTCSASFPRGRCLKRESRDPRSRAMACLQDRQLPWLEAGWTCIHRNDVQGYGLFFCQQMGLILFGTTVSQTGRLWETALPRCLGEWPWLWPRVLGLLSGEPANEFGKQGLDALSVRSFKRQWPWRCSDFDTAVWKALCVFRGVCFGGSSKTVGFPWVSLYNPPTKRCPQQKKRQPLRSCEA